MLQIVAPCDCLVGYSSTLLKSWGHLSTGSHCWDLGKATAIDEARFCYLVLTSVITKRHGGKVCTVLNGAVESVYVGFMKMNLQQAQQNL